MRSGSQPSTQGPGRTDDERRYYALSKRVYAAFAPAYDLLVRPLARLRRRVAAIASIESGTRVLDVATGTGAQAQAFAEEGADVIGIDHSRQMLRIARRKSRASNLTYLECDAANLPFGDAEFDVASVSFALHEMPATVRARVLAEMSRVTRPDGTVIVVDYGLPRNRLSRALVYRAVKLYEREHYAEFIRSDLPAALESAGLHLHAIHSLFIGAVRVVVARRAVTRSP